MEFAKSRSSNAHVLYIYIALPQTEGEKKGFTTFHHMAWEKKNDPTNTTGSFPLAPTAWVVFRPALDGRLCFGEVLWELKEAERIGAMKLQNQSCLFFKSNPKEVHMLVE